MITEDSHEGFHSFADEGGRFEVLDRGNGWYWWPCREGDLPEDDELIGPFATSRDAYEDAVGE